MTEAKWGEINQKRQNWGVLGVAEAGWKGKVN